MSPFGQLQLSVTYLGPKTTGDTRNRPDDVIDYPGDSFPSESMIRSIKHGRGG